jgi:hypothetical protein
MKPETSTEKEKETTPHAAPHRAQRSAAEQDLRPILIDLGSRSKKAIKELKRGEGPLLEEVEDALEEVRQSLGEQYKGNLLPVLVIYRQKQKPEAGAFPFISPFSLLGK